MKNNLPEDFYDKIKPALHRKIGRELRLARYVFDLGCGACELVKDLTDEYHQNVTGVDISTESFPYQKRTPSGRRFRCICCDAGNMDFAADESADGVVIMWALHEMANPDAVVRESYRILRPGGRILIVEFPKSSLAQELWNEDYFEPHEIEQMLLKSGFSSVSNRLIKQGQIMWGSGWCPVD